MTPDELHLTTALRTYARAVEVTDADLDLLEARLEEHIHPTSPRVPRNRPWQLAVAACAVTALVLAATALWRTEVNETLPASPSLTPADLAGVWMVNEATSAGHLWHFTADGQRATTNNPEEYFALEQDLEWFSIGAGDVFTIPDMEDDCRATVHFAPEGTMTLNPLGEANDCEMFTSDRVWRFVRLSPVSLAGATLTEHPYVWPSIPAAEPVHVRELAGTWLLRGTGTILVVRYTSPDEAEYVLDDDGDGPTLADERGSASLRPDGGLVLHPTEGADQGCDTVYEGVLTTGNTLETQLAETSCGRAGAVSGTWIRLN